MSEPLSAIAAYYRSRRLARLAPPPEPAPPVKPEWERLAEEIIDARAARPGPSAEDKRALEGLDPIVFGDAPRVRDGWL